MHSMKNFILGAGITGLAAGIHSGLPIYEAKHIPGGICSSYYIRPKSKEKLWSAPEDEEAYRFEIGGGHWIFGKNLRISSFINELSPVLKYARRSSVYFPEKNLFVPYPLQNNLRYFDNQTIASVIQEIPSVKSTSKTMEEWLRNHFGPTLCRIFFFPFHKLYTANLYKTIAPQDSLKSPVDMALIIKGANSKTPPTGYNVNFAYPKEGLNALVKKMGESCHVHYGKHIIKIDIKSKEIFFSDGQNIKYNKLISTLPLNKMIEMTGLNLKQKSNPYTSVLVLNIGAMRGEKCPDDHWLYIPESRSGFHRVGFYSNVNSSFLPKSVRGKNNRVSIYIEKSYRRKTYPNNDEIAEYYNSVVSELQRWGFIKKVEVMDPTWIEVAYAWLWPGSSWKEEAIRKLEKLGIYQAGRYGRWVFQGIEDSIKEGLEIGESFQSANSKKY